VKTSLSSRARKDRSGQTMVEYIIALVLLLGLVFAFSALSGSLRSNADRTVSLAASEYP